MKAIVSDRKEHIPVLVEECLYYFCSTQLTYFFDGTLGLGGHAEAILTAHPEIQKYVACDRDPEAIAYARERLKPWEHKLEIVHGNFADLDVILKEKGIQNVNGFFLT